MRHCRSLIAAATLLATTISPAIAEPPAVRSIVDQASAAAYYQGEGGKAKVEMVITDAQGRERTRRFTILRTDIGDKDNGEQRFYVHFSRPPDVDGTVFLVWKRVGGDDDRWLYLPALDLVKRIAAGDERTSFVGSHFFYEDVSGRGPREDEHALVETTDTYYVVDGRPKRSHTVAFSRYRSYIHKETFIPVKTEYFDDNGEVYRTYRALEVQTIQGYPTVVKSEMVDSRNGGKTVLRYGSVEYDPGLPEDIFSERYLRNPPSGYLR